MVVEIGLGNEKNLHGIRALLEKSKILHSEKFQTVSDFFCQWAAPCWDLNFAVKMATGLRLEDRLDGDGNFVPWKARLVLILEKNELWDEVVNNTTTNPIVVPASTNAQALIAFNKKDIKARRIILDAVKDHVIPHISSKTHAYQIWDAFDQLISNLKWK